MGFISSLPQLAWD
uniref:Uncharacterized protein n=1 Tax=Arundo donax TaxID=35708 RepID=A0A0A9EMD7_ARUDO